MSPNRRRLCAGMMLASLGVPCLAARPLALAQVATTLSGPERKAALVIGNTAGLPAVRRLVNTGPPELPDTTGKSTRKVPSVAGVSG